MNLHSDLRNTTVIPRRNLNALKTGGGPSTPEGKAIASRNSLKHGLTATQVVIPGENQADFDDLLARLTEDRKPEGELEIQLVGEIAACTWRLTRARSREAKLLEVQGDLFFSAHNPGFERLLRYMGAIERQFNRAVVRLEQLQAARRKQPKHEETPKTMAAGAGASTGLEFVSSNHPHAPITPTAAIPETPVVPDPAARESALQRRP